MDNKQVRELCARKEGRIRKEKTRKDTKGVLKCRLSEMQRDYLGSQTIGCRKKNIIILDSV